MHRMVRSHAPTAARAERPYCRPDALGRNAHLAVGAPKGGVDDALRPCAARSNSGKLYPAPRAEQEKRMAITFAQRLDLRGLPRPKPLLEFAQALIDARPGDLL